MKWSDVSGVANTAIGIGAGLFSNNRAFGQQRELMDVQLQNQRLLNAEAHQYGKDMWEFTNYANQVKQMEKAGLNVGLMYGKGGAGGSTTAQPSGGGASGGNAPMPMDIANMLNQVKLTQAQIENINADTKKKNVEAEKTAGVDTDLGKMQIESLGQGINNQKAQESLTNIQTKINELEYDVKFGAKDELIGSLKNVKYEGDKRIYLLEKQGSITNDQALREKERLNIQLAGMSIMNDLNLSGIAKNEQEIEESKQRIFKMVQDVLQGWDKLDKEQQRIKIDTFRAETERMFPSLDKVVGGQAEKVQNLTENLLKKAFSVVGLKYDEWFNDKVK